MFLRACFCGLVFLLGALHGQDPGAAPSVESAQKSVAPADSSALYVAAHDPVAAGPDRHLIDLLERYVWIVPTASGSRLSLGAAILLVIALVIQLSAKMADIEFRSFGRCVSVAVLLFFAVLAQLSFLPSHALAVVGASLGNVAVWVLAIRCLLGARIWPAMAMLICFLFALLVGVVLLEVAGFLLGGHVMN